MLGDDSGHHMVSGECSAGGEQRVCVEWRFEDRVVCSARMSCLPGAISRLAELGAFAARAADELWDSRAASMPSRWCEDVIEDEWWTLRIGFASASEAVGAPAFVLGPATLACAVTLQSRSPTAPNTTELFFAVSVSGLDALARDLGAR